MTSQTLFALEASLGDRHLHCAAAAIYQVDDPRAQAWYAERLPEQVILGGRVVFFPSPIADSALLFDLATGPFYPPMRWIELGAHPVYEAAKKRKEKFDCPSDGRPSLIRRGTRTRAARSLRGSALYWRAFSTSGRGSCGWMPSAPRRWQTGSGGSDPMWKPKRIAPWFLPFGPDGRTYDPELVVETELFRDELSLTTSPIWQIAPITRIGRELLPRCIGRGWHVRRLGQTDPVATVLWLTAHPLDGRIVSAAPERVNLTYADRLLVIMAELVIGVRGTDPRHAFGHLADVLLDTRHGEWARRRRRSRHATGPVDEIAALCELVP